MGRIASEEVGLDDAVSEDAGEVVEVDLGARNEEGIGC